jgi:hypothetical protein
MQKQYVYYELVGKCRKFGTNVNNSKGEARQHVVVRFKNERVAEQSQLGNNFEDIKDHFQSGLPMGWVLDLDYFGIECNNVISEEEANRHNFIIVE